MYHAVEIEQSFVQDWNPVTPSGLQEFAPFVYSIKHFRPVERYCAGVLRFFVNDCLVRLARLRSSNLGSGALMMLGEMWLNKCGEYWPQQQREEE